MQDSHIFLALDPSWTRKQILLHARHQFLDGAVLHWWHTLLESGPKTHMTDDFLWLPFLTLGYLKETCDWSILSQPEPYRDGPPGTLHDHCDRAFKLVLSRFSKRGLPLIGEGDWCDGFRAH